MVAAAQAAARCCSGERARPGRGCLCRLADGWNACASDLPISARGAGRGGRAGRARRPRARHRPPVAAAGSRSGCRRRAISIFRSCCARRARRGRPAQWSPAGRRGAGRGRVGRLVAGARGAAAEMAERPAAATARKMRRHPGRQRTPRRRRLDWLVIGFGVNLAHRAGLAGPRRRARRSTARRRRAGGVRHAAARPAAITGGRCGGRRASRRSGRLAARAPAAGRRRSRVRVGDPALAGASPGSAEDGSLLLDIDGTRRGAFAAGEILLRGET